jgi:type II secretory pathway predicted ATPase ExeA
MRRFNTAGPCDPAKHYTLLAAERLPEAARLIDDEGYFVLHAPRQTGKTTSLQDLARRLTAEGRYAALHVSCEKGEAWGEDIAAAERNVVDEIVQRSFQALSPELYAPAVDLEAPPGGRLSRLLTAWAQACPRPVVLILDEIDALIGASLISVLRQLRAGFSSRPAGFPSSVILCGLRDVRDYKAFSGGDPVRMGTASPFNIKVESLRLGNFTREETVALYGQHSVETGQVFEQEALDAAWEATEGQPWLVNALAREVVEKIGVPSEQSISAAHIDEARERLILTRQTHLDSLVARLMEPRVRRFIEPMMAGDLASARSDGEGLAYDDDVQYVRDLGLIAQERPLRVANSIYREVIARVLASAAEDNIVLGPRSFVRADGSLDLRSMLDEFVAFWCEHGENLAADMPYHEVAPQLVLMAFLQRVVNSGGYVDREYGVGRGRIDLLVRWPLPDAVSPRQWQREALELKVWREGEADPLARGLKQLDDYLARLGLDDGALVIFDRREGREAPEARTRFEEAVTASGRAVRVLRA